MRLVIALSFLLPAIAFGQRDLYSEIRSGAPQGWPATTSAFTFDVPEPIGPIALTFRVEVEPISLNPSNRSDGFRLVAGQVIHRDLDTIIDLPKQFLACLPRPQPHAVLFRTLYIDPAESGRPWPEEFTMYVAIPFGSPSAVSYSVGEILEYPTVEFRITGGEIRRAEFIKPNGDSRMLQDVSDSCPRDFVDWALLHPPPSEVSSDSVEGTTRLNELIRVFRENQSAAAEDR